LNLSLCLQYQVLTLDREDLHGSIVNECYDDRDDVTENDELMTGGDC